MNAIAEREDGSLYDPFDGTKDIKHKIISCVGKASDRFREDKLRIFRAIRFSVVLGFRMDDEIQDSIFYDFNKLEDFSGVSVERIQIELWKAFAHDTITTIIILNTFPRLWEVVVDKGIRLKPTLEK